MVNGSKHTLSQWLTVLKHTHTLLCVDGTRSGKLTRSPLAVAPMSLEGGVTGTTGGCIGCWGG